MNGKFSPKGVYCAMVTPFDENGEVKYDTAGQMTEFMVSKKVDGVFTVSNVGEFLQLTMEEKKKLISTVIGSAGGRMRVTPGITDLSLRKTLELARFCAEQGADGVVVCAPYYYPYTQDYIKQFIKTVADQSPLPVILYNSPSFTNRIDFENLIDLCSHDNIIAIKESSGDVRFLIKLLSRIGAQVIDVNVLVGWEELLFTGLELGAAGCITSCGGIVPEILKKIYDSVARGDRAEALRCQKDVVEITNALSAVGFPQGYKLGVMARGFDFNIYADGAFADQEKAVRARLGQVKDLIDGALARL